MTPGQALVSRFRSDPVTDWSALADAIDEMVAWRDMASAPRDGTKILAYCIANGVGYQSVIWWRGEKYRTWNEPGYQWRNHLNDSATGGFADGLRNPGPINWRPLPLPPSGDPK